MSGSSGKLYFKELFFNTIIIARPPAPEIQEIVEVELPNDAQDSEEFVFKGSTHPDVVLAGLSPKYKPCYAQPTVTF